MTGAAFLSALKHELASLSDNQRKEAMSYFAEYLAEVGDDQAAIAELGTPKEVAKELIEQFREQDILEQTLAEVSSQEYSNVEEIKLDLTSLDLVVEESDVAEVEVEANESVLESLEIERREGRLEIKQKHDFRTINSFTIFGFGFNFTQTGKVIVKTPRNQKVEQISINSLSGDVDLKNLKLNHLGCHLTNGDLDLKGMEVDSLKLHLTNGDLELKTCQFENIKAELYNGDADLVDILVAEILDLDLKNGDVKMTSSQFKDMSLNNLHGDVELRQPNFTGQTKMTLLYGDVQVDLTEELRQLLSIDLKASNGDYSVRDASGRHYGENGFYRYGNLTQSPSLEISNSYGDIVIN
ncbi:DUF4097 family beta strand repeat-containing protein [Streptococcus porci]|uniref:DUF4097 family beta strand repeat-containing protein n=1 Tax=Streptococcus porci TaxID=502567 RepID=UPI000415F5E7|nr:DUF4097 family beta strand repeat-containing protein [Streptococcus porci]